jgi:hypothetical protein
MPDATSPPSPKPGIKQRLQLAMARYGRVVLPVYFAIFALTLAGFALAIRSGWQTEGAVGAVGVWAAAYAATKLTQPLRIGATLLLTPVVAGALARLRRTTGAPRQ